MKKNIVTIFLILIIVVIIAAGFVIPEIIMGKPTFEYFENISDWDFLDELIVETIEDKHIGSIEFTEGFGIKVKYDDKYFEVFAYVFKDVQAAQTYYLSAAGGDSLGNSIEEEAYSAGDIYFSNKLAAYKANCAYRISGGGYPAFGNFIDFVNEHLQE